MRPRPHALLTTLALALAPAFAVVLAGAGCSGCDERAAASPGDDAAAPPPPPPAPTVPAPPADAGARPEPPAPGPAKDAQCELRVLKSVFTSEVKNKEPTDVLKSAKPGQRVYAHLTVRNRCEAVRTLKVAFKVNGAERAAVDLDVDPSWSFRTWAYVTLRKADTGKVELEVKDDAGAVLVSSTLPIKPDDPTPVPLHR